jgi:membrane-bound inhibitor of C-type lysozyme
MRRRKFITLLGAAGIVIRKLPVSAQTFVTYRCHDGSEFIVAFYEGDRRAHLQLDGKAVALPRRISLSGSRYANRDYIEDYKDGHYSKAWKAIGRMCR